MSIAEALREERNVKTAPLARFFTEYNSKKNNICYGFVEGKDDPSYYRTIINNKLPQNCSIILYPSNGKKNIKYIYDEIQKRNFPSNRISYFMDRDLSIVIHDPDLILNERVYITDNYSIENDILSEETFIYILQDILGFSSINPEQIENVTTLFRREKSKFEEMMIPIMANIIYWKQKGINANYKNFKIKEIISISNCKVSLLFSQSETIKILYKQSNVNYASYYNEEEEQKISSMIKSNNLSKKILRGKYLASFFICFCNSLFNDCNHIGLSKIGGRILSQNDIFETVAPRSKPPYSLICFIENIVMKCYK